MRCKLTWQQFDHKLYQTAFYTTDLEKFVMRLDEWKKNVRNTVLEMEDEVPIWVAIAPSKKIVSQKAVAGMRRRGHTMDIPWNF